MVTQQRKEGKLIIVSNRLPLSIKKENGSYKSSLSSGGLVTALSGLTKSMNFQWFGWPGIGIEDPKEQEEITKSLEENNAVGIFLDAQLAHDHYNQFSSLQFLAILSATWVCVIQPADLFFLADGVLWPILHYQSGVGFDEGAWKAYQRVNEIFANIVSDEANDGDLIWVHDYHLMLLPSLLRERLRKQGKHCRIGFTLHTPFPAEDFWRALPTQNELVKGVLGSSIVGFHTDEYKRNFTESCARGLGADVDVADQVQYNGHKSSLGTFIVGIDPQKFNDAMQDPNVLRRIKELENQYKNKMVIIGVDRLDYTKGLVQKLEGYDTFLDQHPELRNKVTLIQVAVPSREDVKEYQDLETQISTLTGKINGKYATPDDTPLIYMHRSVSFTELTALYTVSDVCLLTSRRDGMNLVASEYVACQENRYGVLVLSELAGAASFMKPGSLTFHPSRVQDLSDAIYTAVTMDRSEKKDRYQHLRDFITANTSAKWGASFVNALWNQAQQ